MVKVSNIYSPSFAIAENCPYIRRIKNNPTMADINQTTNTGNFLEEPQKLPSMLNVLTILTFIGSGIGAISMIFYAIDPKKSYDQVLAAQDKIDQAPEFLKKIMGPNPVEVARKTYENHVAIILLAFVALALCIYGAVQMRKWSKIGFTIYAIGEILPLASVLIFIGAIGLGGPVALISYIILPLLFIGLYATQLKALT
jgi:hypothetical protein